MLFKQRSKPVALLNLGLFLICLTLGLNLLSTGTEARAAEGGMCAGQSAITDKEVAEAFNLLAEIIKMGDKRSPADEENLIRGRGLSSERLNCIFGKIMAGNDIFGWGGPGEYGVSLSDAEKKIIQKYSNESKGLKKYLEDELNIRSEKE